MAPAVTGAHTYTDAQTVPVATCMCPSHCRSLARSELLYPFLQEEHLRLSLHPKGLAQGHTQPPASSRLESALLNHFGVGRKWAPVEMKQLPHSKASYAAGVGAKPHYPASSIPNLVSGVCLALGVPSSVLWEHSFFCPFSHFYFFLKNTACS